MASLSSLWKDLLVCLVTRFVESHFSHDHLTPFSTVNSAGTGKTHTIVNITATAMSVDKSVLVTSCNTRALAAYYEKLPDRLRPLALDVACCEEGDVTKLQQALEKLIFTLNNLEMEEGAIDKVRRVLMKSDK